jgi:hypothetical protein
MELKEGRQARGPPAAVGVWNEPIADAEVNTGTYNPTDLSFSFSAQGITTTGRFDGTGGVSGTPTGNTCTVTFIWTASSRAAAISSSGASQLARGRSEGRLTSGPASRHAAVERLRR